MPAPRSGAHARHVEDGQLELRGWVGLPDGSQWISDRVVGSGDEVGAEVARRLLALGAAELLSVTEQAAEAARAADHGTGAGGQRAGGGNSAGGGNRA